MCNEQSKKPVPHVHAETIKAWADGAKIQSFVVELDGWFDDENPNWFEGRKYRVKPKPMVKKYLIVYSRNAFGSTCYTATNRYFKDVKEFSMITGYRGSRAHIIPSSMIEVEED